MPEQIRITIDGDLSRRNNELFAEHVTPRFRDL